MVRESKIKAAAHISVAEFHRWMRSSRLIILGVILIFIHIQVIVPLKECALLMETPVSIPEAFVALGNSGLLLLVIPVLFLVLMADFPQKDGIDVFYQIRCGKKVWICGQILFALEAALFLVIFLAVASMLMIWDSGEWRMSFSRAVTHYTTVFPERSRDYVVQLLPENIYHQMTLGTAMLHTALFTFLHFLLLSLVLLYTALYNKKKAGIFIDGFLLILGAVTCEVRMDAMWLLPMAHTIPWVHFETYLDKEVFPVTGSYLYLLGGCAVLTVLCLAASGKYQAGKD